METQSVLHYTRRYKVRNHNDKCRQMRLSFPKKHLIGNLLSSLLPPIFMFIVRLQLLVAVVIMMREKDGV